MQTLLQELVALRDLLSQHTLFTIGTLLVVGYVAGKLASRVKLPEVTGFIIAGLLLGDTFVGIVPLHMREPMKVVTEVALGLIALTIGGEFSRSKLKRTGREVLVITFFQLALSFATVAVGMWVFRIELPFALMLGAIASATAPAATVAIVHSLRAHGLFVDYLYGIVALDDAAAVVLFGVIFAAASSLLGVSGQAAHAGSVALHAVSEVLLSVLIGAVGGVLIHLATWKRRSNNEILIIALGLVFLTTAVAIVFELSPLLANMATGAVLINISSRNHRIFRILEPLTPPIYALFFVVAGTELRPAIFLQTEVLLLGIVYVVARAIGKYGGVFLGCLTMDVPTHIRNNLGFSMLPQAGVAIGLVLLIQASPLAAQLAPGRQAVINTMVNIVLFSVFVNELAGPPLSRYAVVKGTQLEE